LIYSHIVLVDRNGLNSSDYQQKINEMDQGWDKVTRVIEPKKRGAKRIPYRLKNTFRIAWKHRFGRGKVIKKYGTNPASWSDNG